MSSTGDQPQSYGVQLKPLTWPQHAVNYAAGGVAGASVDLILFPIDTIKTRLQARRAVSVSGGGSVNSALPKLNLRSFYSGVGINCTGSFLSAGAFFGLYELAKQRVYQAAPNLASPVNHMLSAALADVGCCAIRVPFEGIKQRLQAGLHANTWAAVRAVYQQRGVAGFYAGFVSTVMREIPFDAIEFALYEVFKSTYARRFGVTEHTVGTVPGALMGAVAGAIAAASTCPLDVVKTRLMTQVAKPGEPGFYRSTLHCFSSIVREEGVRALFKGIGPRVMWISIGGSIFFSAYETSKRLMLDTYDLR